jgi:hypothetical protein
LSIVGKFRHCGNLPRHLEEAIDPISGSTTPPSFATGKHGAFPETFAVHEG